MLSMPKPPIKHRKSWNLAIKEVQAAVPFKASYCDRDKGLASQWRHITTLVPEILEGWQTVIDIGPGPGYFLDLARELGCTVIGIDAVPISPAVRAYKLCTAAQELNVHYSGAPTDGSPLPVKPGTAHLIQFKGSVEAVLQPKVAWLMERATNLLKACQGAVSTDGRILILHNVSDPGVCREAILAAAPAAGLSVTIIGPAITELRRSA